MTDEKHPLGKNDLLDKSIEDFTQMVAKITSQDRTPPPSIIKETINDIQARLEQLRILNPEDTKTAATIEDMISQLDEIYWELSPITLEESGTDIQEDSEKPTFEKPVQQKSLNNPAKRKTPVINLLSVSFNAVISIGLTTLMTARPIASLTQKLLP